MKNLENFYRSFKFLPQVSLLLHEIYSEESNIEFIEHNWLEQFVESYLDSPDTFEEIFNEVY